MQINMYANTHARGHTHTHARRHTHTHTHTHRRTHVHTHTTLHIVVLIHPITYRVVNWSKGLRCLCAPYWAN